MTAVGDATCSCGCGLDRRWTIDENGCWLWQGALYAGYGRIQRSGRKLRAHRFVYEHHHGAVPPGLTLDHLCRVRACVNPAHLEPVSNKENVRRGLATRLTAEAVAEIRASNRPLAELAATFGVTAGYVSNLRANLRSEQRWTEVEPVHRLPSRSALRNAEILRMRHAGMLNYEIAGVLGCSQNAVTRAVSRMRAGGVAVPVSPYIATRKRVA